MRHGSLFSGIGGFDLAAEWMAWENVFHCEWNPFGQKVLKYYWPKAISYDDITKTDFTVHRGAIDILTGGFPCQPYSSAGKRKGKEDERHLWPQMLRAIREITPSWVVGENVYGLVNWSGGLVFHEVQADLEAQGYEVFPFLLPAVSVNAPHRRDRIWFVAKNTNNNGRRSEQREEESCKWEQRYISSRNNEWISTHNDEIRSSSNTNNTRTDIGMRSQSEWSEDNGNGGFAQPESWKDDGNGVASNTNNNGLNECNSNNEINASEGREYALGDIDQGGGNGGATDTNSTNSKTWSQREILGQQNREKTNGYSNVERRNQWQNFPTVSPICIGDDGLSNRLDSITFPKWRNESIKAGGNAIVPQVVYQIFKSIEQYEREYNSRPH